MRRYKMTGSKVIQVTNIAPQATKDQMQTLFGYLGKIEDIRLYPTIRDVAVPVQSRICYVKFHDPVCVGVAQHLTNTVFIDRALIVVPFQSSEFHPGEIPDEQKALELTNQGTNIPGLFPSESKLPPNVSNQIEGTPPNQFIHTFDPRLEANGLPPYPPLPANLDSRKIEEIRRTLVVGQIDSSTTAQHVLEFASKAGEVKYIRFCIRNEDKKHYALMEFTDQGSVIAGLKLNDTELHGKKVKVYHSIQAIVKPQTKSNEAAQREIEEAMSRVKEAQNLISAAIDPVIGLLGKEKRSRSRSRSRRSRSRSRGRHSSHSRSRRSRSRSRRRSRSRGRVRSHSRTRRSHSRSKRSRSRSRSGRSRSKSKLKSSRSKSSSIAKDRKEDELKKDAGRKSRDVKENERDSVVEGLDHLEGRLEGGLEEIKEEDEGEEGEEGASLAHHHHLYLQCDLENIPDSIKGEESEMELERKLGLKGVDKEMYREMKGKGEKDDKLRDLKGRDRSERCKRDREKAKGKSKEKSGSGGKPSREKVKSPRPRSRSRSRRRHSPSPRRHRKSRSRTPRRRSSRSPLPPPRRKSRSPRRHSRSRSRHKSLSRSLRRSPSHHGSRCGHPDSRSASIRRSVSRRKSKSPSRGGRSRRSRSRKRSRSQSKSRKDKECRGVERSRDMDRRDRDKSERKRRGGERRDDEDARRRDAAKVPRNYDEEEKGFDEAGVAEEGALRGIRPSGDSGSEDEERGSGRRRAEESEEEYVAKGDDSEEEEEEAFGEEERQSNDGQRASDSGEEESEEEDQDCHNNKHMDHQLSSPV
ncbi:probable splicing factor, arginine/serine-rich 7 isoform X3 [Ischnura elegans]|uniref:probable splicing factor, arginine/serine-rich 7 isoform X3 n=1 Tax=Ischnura elegans TaxID=197161 RepID=UPI001ED88D83|nr:probable splicing factor, arginine/serine-rich 7 isoform X3 [Ischnura elegans]